MKTGELFIIFIGAPVVLVILYFTLRPDRPESKRRSVQVGLNPDARVTPRGVFWFYAIIIIFVLGSTLYKLVSK